MKMVSSFNKMHILLCLLLATLTTGAQGQTRIGFYDTTCPTFQTIVQTTVQSAFRSNPAVAAGLLRMFFHDCFVLGCDASVLLSGPSTERTAPPNLSLVGFEVIDAAKLQIETACPGVVSCADILALAARDAVVLAGGIGWRVPTGRRDGLVSQASNTVNLPAFNDPISVQISKFTFNSLLNCVILCSPGGHTIGTAACAVFSYRLYNFSGTNQPDPDINPVFLPQLRRLCPNGGNGSTRVALDTGSVNRFDTSYFVNVRNGRGVLESDAKLMSNPTTRTLVQRFSGAVGGPALRFTNEFAISMVKLGNTELKTGSQGEIRRVCSAIN
ncbi:peroxidase N1-like isoform X3 [Cynara cardunculus var. scolymus]|uniref:peroxidase N1-like isoform X3 n=1 Tax=Cynara cardunculus var. scolymus TaxID=59895 RepID=UPI000D62EBC3|nr:peroxidase N1-like isoform X3 [Cynara cardunculus var. scolymus]